MADDNGQQHLSVEAQLAAINANIDAKPGPLVVFATMLAALAIPTAIIIAWFPGEIAELKAEIAELKEEVELVSEAAMISSAASQKTLSQLETLVVAMARNTAVAEKTILMSGFRRHVPNETVQFPLAGGMLEGFTYSKFNEKEWMFVAEPEYMTIPPEARQVIEESFERGGVILVVD